MSDRIVIYLLIASVISIVLSLSYMAKFYIEKEKLKIENTELKENAITNKKAIDTMLKKLKEARQMEEATKEALNEIIKNNPDWCNVTLPFDFNSMCKSKDSILPSTRTTTK